MELKALKELLRESGVVGAGGAGFPTYAKLDERADTIILNCAECEPILRLHRQLMENRTREILTGMSVIMQAVGAKEGIIALKGKYENAIRLIESELPDFPDIRIHKLESIYPSGDELLMIRDVTGKRVKPGELPISVGVTVNNVETVYNVYRAIKGDTVTEKYVTVAGEVRSPRTMLAPLGMRISELIERAGGVTVDKPYYMMGGVMMGRLGDASEFVTKTTNAVIVLPESNEAVAMRRQSPKISLNRAMSVCCQCRMCTELCSRYIAGYPVEPHMVMRILSSGGRGDLKRIEGAVYCSGCGLCELYACPMSLSPKILIDQIKAEYKSKGVPFAKCNLGQAVADEANKKVSVGRLTARLGLSKYDVECEFDDTVMSCETVRIMLTQHIGAASKAVVKSGDTVGKGEVVALAAEKGLGVNIHSSIDGVVEDVTDRYIRVRTAMK